MVNRSEALFRRLFDTDQNLIVLKSWWLKDWLSKGEGGGWVQGAPRLDKASLNQRERRKFQIKEMKFLCSVSAQLQLRDDLSCLCWSHRQEVLMWARSALPMAATARSQGFRTQPWHLLPWKLLTTMLLVPWISTFHRGWSERAFYLLWFSLSFAWVLYKYHSLPTE